MKATNMIALTLVVIGALNWGLIGFFGFDLVTTLFHGSLFWLARVIFALVGLSGLWCLTLYHNDWAGATDENDKAIKATKEKAGVFARVTYKRERRKGVKEYAFYKNAGLRE